jgi:hypothetical protein
LYTALFNNALAALNLLEKSVLAILQPDNGIRLKYKCFTYISSYTGGLQLSISAKAVGWQTI